MITDDRLETLPKRLIVTFAADCAEHVLPIFERAYPDDPRPREAIAATRDWLEGRASQERLDRALVGANRASSKPLGSHAVTGAPGWMTGLLPNDTESAAGAAAGAAAAALAANEDGKAAQGAGRVAVAAVMAVVWAAVDQSGMDFAAAKAYTSPLEEAWQAERLAHLRLGLGSSRSLRHVRDSDVIGQMKAIADWAAVSRPHGAMAGGRVAAAKPGFDAEPDVLVIDDERTFQFPAVYARTANAGMTELVQRPWREVWLDHNLGAGLTIEPVMEMLEESASRGRPLPIGIICIHTSDPDQADAMLVRVEPWYRVRRVFAHSFLATS